MRSRSGIPLTQYLGLALVVAALTAAFAGTLFGGGAGAALFASGAVGLPFGLMVAASPPRARRGWWLGLAGAFLSVAGATVVVLRPEWAARTFAGGWPAGALAALVGYWLLPLVLLGAAAALALPSGESGADPSDEDGAGDASR